jgi:hypothetical protein
MPLWLPLEHSVCFNLLITGCGIGKFPLVQSVHFQSSPSPMPRRPQTAPRQTPLGLFPMEPPRFAICFPSLTRRLPHLPGRPLNVIWASSVGRIVMVIRPRKSLCKTKLNASILLEGSNVSAFSSTTLKVILQGTSASRNRFRLFLCGTSHRHNG